MPLSNDETFVQRSYQKQGPKLAAFLHRTLGNHDLANDLIQQTFLIFMEKKIPIDSDRDACAYLFGIAKKLVMSQWREQKASRAITEEDLEGQATSGGQALWAKQALAQLPDDLRLILVLKEYHGFCYEELAQILAIPPGTVRSRLHRAREMLINMFGTKEEERS